MPKDITKIIQEELKKHGKVTSEKVAQLADISRQGAHKHLSSLVKQQKLIKIGKTRRTYYIPYSPEKEKEIKEQLAPVRLHLKNKGLQEDLIFDRLELTSGLIGSLSSNSKGIFRYAFTEMLNNAIEHSRSANIKVNISGMYNSTNFEVIDSGIGIFNNIKNKYKLKDNFEALQELLKGKRTTAPKKHSGEGIFFTSKIADQFKVESSKIKLIINNQIKDIIIEEIASRQGTKVSFEINKQSKKDLSGLFNEYTNEEYKFSKTKVTINLYEKGVDYVSRSQARRILYGLETFQSIVLDFKKIKRIGQSFADEIFRVFQSEHPEINLTPVNACKVVIFMINRAKAHGLQ